MRYLLVCSLLLVAASGDPLLLALLAVLFVALTWGLVLVVGYVSKHGLPDTLRYVGCCLLARADAIEAARDTYRANRDTYSADFGLAAAEEQPEATELYVGGTSCAERHE